MPQATSFSKTNSVLLGMEMKTNIQWGLHMCSHLRVNNGIVLFSCFIITAFVSCVFPILRRLYTESNETKAFDELCVSFSILLEIYINLGNPKSCCWIEEFFHLSFSIAWTCQCINFHFEVWEAIPSLQHYQWWFFIMYLS